MFDFSSQIILCQVLKKAEGKESTETVEESKEKEEKLEVAGGKCWRQKWQSALCFTGEIFNEDIHWRSYLQLSKQLAGECLKKYYSENWILPIVILFAMVAYAILAIVFYNKDGWFQFVFFLRMVWLNSMFNVNSVVVQQYTITIFHVQFNSLIVCSCLMLSVFYVVGVNWAAISYPSVHLRILICFQLNVLNI